jgi:hypothetical protein
MNMRFRAKDVPFIRTSGSKMKRGEGMEKCGNKALMLEYLDRCGRNLDHCVAPT